VSRPPPPPPPRTSKDRDAHVYAALKMRQNVSDALALRIREAGEEPQGQQQGQQQQQKKKKKLLMKRRTSLSAGTVSKAVTHHQVANLQQQQMEHREQFQTNLKQREMQADLRVQARVKERNEKKGRNKKEEVGGQEQQKKQKKKQQKKKQQQQQQQSGVKIVPVNSGQNLTQAEKVQHFLKLQKQLNVLKRVTKAKIEERKEEEELAREFGSDSD